MLKNWTLVSQFWFFDPVSGKSDIKSDCKISRFTPYFFCFISNLNVTFSLTFILLWDPSKILRIWNLNKACKHSQTTLTNFLCNLLFQPFLLVAFYWIEVIWPHKDLGSEPSLYSFPNKTNFIKLRLDWKERFHSWKDKYCIIIIHNYSNIVQSPFKFVNDWWWRCNIASS